MIKRSENKPGRKSRIAVRARNRNLILSILILVLMSAIVAGIISGISNDEAKALVRAYSMEAAQNLYSYISNDLVLVQNMSNSTALANWMLNENDQEKKAIAFDAIKDYSNLLKNPLMYIGVDRSKNEYIITGTTQMESFLPYDPLDPLNPGNKWYVDCINSANEHTIQFDVDKFTKSLHLWINHKVTANGIILGVFSSGLGIPDIFKKIIDKSEIETVRGYIINKKGDIQLDSGASGIYNPGNQGNILDESSDPAFTAAITAHLESINGLFDSNGEPGIFRLSKIPHGYFSINPIEKTDWTVVIFYRYGMFSGYMKILPLLLVMLVALFLYIAGSGNLMRRLLFEPLSRLMQDISSGRSTKPDFFGTERDDEIGDLARTIQDVTGKEQRQKHLLQAVDRVAVILLAPANE